MCERFALGATQVVVADPRRRPARARAPPRHLVSSAACPPARTKSSTSSIAMYIGSIAIVDIDEYGDVSPAGTVPSGRIISRSNPAPAAHSPSVARSGSSPIPQLREDGAEKSGISRPA